MKPTEKRYFLALIPPEPLYSDVMKIKEYFRDQYACKAPLRSPPHLTLHLPFLWKEPKEKELIRLLTQASGFSPFRIRLNGFGAFPPRTIFIRNEPCPPLMDFQKKLTRHTWRTMKLFNPTHNKGFHPHITVAFRDLKKEKFYEAWQEFEQKPFSGLFEVTSCWLLKHDGKMWHAYREFLFGEAQA